MNKPIDASSLNPNNPVESMFMQLLMAARMNPSERKLVADLFNQHQGVRPLSGPQQSLLVGIYLKHHDAEDLPKKTHAVKERSTAPVVAPSKEAARWTKFLSK